MEKVRDTVGLYLSPPENRTEPILPPADTERHGVTSWFAAMDVASGVTISSCFRRHRHQEVSRFLKIEDKLPAGLDVHLG